MGTPEWISIATLLVAGVGVPLLIFMSSRQDADRHAKFGDMHARLDHLDGCVDEVRGIVMSKGVTREDLMSHKSEILDTINRMRLAVSSETTGLHQRIMRLEDRYFKERGDD